MPTCPKHNKIMVLQTTQVGVLFVCPVKACQHYEKATQSQEQPVNPSDHPREPSTGETLFLQLWQTHGDDTPMEAEYSFDSVRNWRLDFAFPSCRVAVEIESSVHRIQSRFVTDMAKYNALTLQDWALLRVTRQQLEDRGEQWIRTIRDLLDRRSNRKTS